MHPLLRGESWAAQSSDPWVVARWDMIVGWVPVCRGWRTRRATRSRSRRRRRSLWSLARASSSGCVSRWRTRSARTSPFWCARERSAVSFAQSSASGPDSSCFCGGHVAEDRIIHLLMLWVDSQPRLARLPPIPSFVLRIPPSPPPTWPSLLVRN